MGLGLDLRRSDLEKRAAEMSGSEISFEARKGV